MQGNGQRMMYNSIPDSCERDMIQHFSPCIIKYASNTYNYFLQYVNCFALYASSYLENFVFTLRLKCFVNKNKVIHNYFLFYL